MSDLSLPGTLVAGVISFLSPCVLPLVPPYLVYLTGMSIEEVNEHPDQKKLVQHTFIAALCFVAGFSTVFVALGAGASAIGTLLRAYADVLSIVAGCVILLMGLHFLGIFRLTALMRQVRFELLPLSGRAGAYLMGLAFAFGWTPCIGPVLAAVLAVAASEDTALKGAGLLAVYSLGLGVPFLAAALMMGSVINGLNRLHILLPWVERVMGGLLVLTALVFLSGGLGRASIWLLEHFPALATLG